MGLVMFTSPKGKEIFFLFSVLRFSLIFFSLEIITEFTWVNAVISAKYEHVGLLERVVKHDCIVVNERKQNTSLDYYILVRESYLKKLEKHVQENHLIDFYLI